MQGKRTERVAELIRETVADLLVTFIKDPRIGLVSITSVKVSPDLRLAKVFFSVFGEDEQIKQSEKGLKNAEGVIKRELGRRLNLRYIPDLDFCYDQALAKSGRIQELLNEIESSQQTCSPEEAEEEERNYD